MRICIYAYSVTAYFFRALVGTCDAAGDDVEWSAIFPQGHFRHLFRGAIPAERQCYLYADFNVRYAHADGAALDRGLAAGEGLAVALMKDKDGYCRLEKDEQLRRAATVHGCYESFLDRVRPDFVLFPDLEVVDGFVLMNLCRARGIGVLYFVSLRFLGRSFFSSDSYETLPPYFGAYDAADLTAARAVLAAFRERGERQAGAAYRPAPPRLPSLWRRLVVSPWLRLRYERRHASEETLKMRIARNWLGATTRIRRWRFEHRAERYFDPPSAIPGKYVYYALHYTPESSVNGLEPYFVDQLRAVDALLLNLPAGYRLVVKEHPAMIGLRPLSVYRALRRRPGLVLIHPSVDSRTLIEGAAIVASVTGTVAFEAWLMGKPALMFGRTFFAHLCRRAGPLHALRATMEDMLNAHMPASEAAKETEIAKLLNIGADFIIGDPWSNPQTMAPENVAAGRELLWRHIARLEAAR
jgi:hypothetical protein